MRENTNEKQLQTGDIILFYPTGFISSTIAELTDSKYSHTGIYYGKLHGKHLFYDIDWTDSKFILYENVDRDFDVYRYKDELNRTQKANIQASMVKRLNKSYDYTQLFSSGFHIIFGLEAITNNPNKYLCSELIDLLYYDINIDLNVHVKKGNTIPEDLAETIKTKYICNRSEIIL
jgi:hypothetical protein